MSFRRASARALATKPSTFLTPARSIQTFRISPCESVKTQATFSLLSRRFLSQTPRSLADIADQELSQSGAEGAAAGSEEVAQPPQDETEAEQILQKEPVEEVSTINSASKASGQGENEDSSTVYVGNLFFEVKAADLADKFKSAGKIVRATVIEDRRGLSKG